MPTGQHRKLYFWPIYRLAAHSLTARSEITPRSRLVIEPEPQRRRFDCEGLARDPETRSWGTIRWAGTTTSPGVDPLLLVHWVRARVALANHGGCGVGGAAVDVAQGHAAEPDRRHCEGAEGGHGVGFLLIGDVLLLRGGE